MGEAKKYDLVYNHAFYQREAEGEMMGYILISVVYLFDFVIKNTREQYLIIYHLYPVLPVSQKYINKLHHV